ncbi:MAG TPA: hypothetical protein VN896_06085 [Methylomirabilota bacterium]|jgi:plastocyanin|nr:hypothetical protein [Methylomirabilota bacterium]
MQSRLARGALALALFAAILAGCSKSSDSTAPTPPVIGPTFSLAFPAQGTAGTPGTSNRLFFHDVGAWAYHCIPHGSSGMTGTINVVVGAADSAFVQVGAGNTLSFSPATVTIDTGGYVRWANVSNMSNHTVTRP